jgi:hypothetical protein
VPEQQRSPGTAQGPELRPYLWAGVGLTAFWALLAYPVVVTVGWGFLVQLVLFGWAAIGFAYWLQRKKHRSTD